MKWLYFSFQIVTKFNLINLNSKSLYEGKLLLINNYLIIKNALYEFLFNLSVI